MKMRFTDHLLDFGRYVGIAADITTNGERHRRSIRFPVCEELTYDQAKLSVQALRDLADFIEGKIES